MSWRSPWRWAQKQTFSKIKFLRILASARRWTIFSDSF